jgi:hypothetical protein
MVGIVRGVAVLALLALPPGALGADERVIAVHDERVTVRLSSVPVYEVLDEIGRQTGAEIRGEPRTPGNVNAEFEDVPFPEALHRLLGDQNFALVYAGNGELRTVKLLGGPVSDAVIRPAAAPSDAPDLMTMIANHDPVNLYGNLAAAIGPTTSLQQLFELGVRHDDSEVRGEALRTIMAVIETEPALKNALAGQLSTLDDAALTTLLRRMAGAHAEEVATVVLSQSRAGDLRTKATAVLKRLKSPAAAPGYPSRDASSTAHAP